MRKLSLIFANSLKKEVLYQQNLELFSIGRFSFFQGENATN